MGLLEVVAALAIFTFAGLGLLARLGAMQRETVAAGERGRRMAEAERLLVAHALLTRGDLDRRLGVRDHGAYLVSVQRPRRTVYRVAVAAASAPEVEELVTVVFRPEAPVAP